MVCSTLTKADLANHIHDLVMGFVPNWNMEPDLRKAVNDDVKQVFMSAQPLPMKENDTFSSLNDVIVRFTGSGRRKAAIGRMGCVVGMVAVLV